MWEEENRDPPKAIPGAGTTAGNAAWQQLTPEQRALADSPYGHMVATSLTRDGDLPAWFTVWSLRLEGISRACDVITEGTQLGLWNRPSEKPWWKPKGGITWAWCQTAIALYEARQKERKDKKAGRSA